MLVSGTIKDQETLQSIPSVGVFYSDPNGTPNEDAGGLQGTMSDIEGFYQINVVPEDYVVFKMIGYPDTVKTGAELISDSNVYMNEGGGTSLNPFTIVAERIENAPPDLRKYHLAVIGGLAALLLLALLLYAKTKKWI